jgi:hypothetical protein
MRTSYVKPRSKLCATAFFVLLSIFFLDMLTYPTTCKSAWSVANESAPTQMSKAASS